MTSAGETPADKCNAVVLTDLRWSKWLNIHDRNDNTRFLRVFDYIFGYAAH